MSPLISGSGEDIIQRNIAELMRTYKRTGRIGNTKPRDINHARRISSAIAYEKAKGH